MLHKQKVLIILTNWNSYTDSFLFGRVELYAFGGTTVAWKTPIMAPKSVEVQLPKFRLRQHSNFGSVGTMAIVIENYRLIELPKFELPKFELPKFERGNFGSRCCRSRSLVQTSAGRCLNGQCRWLHQIQHSLVIHCHLIIICKSEFMNSVTRKTLSIQKKHLAKY